MEPKMRSTIRIVTQAFLILSAAALAIAQSAAVRFDTLPTVACHDASSAEHLALKTGTRMIAAEFHVSALLLQGVGNDIEQLIVHFDNPERTMSVIDFSPRTSLTTDTVGNMQVNRSEQERDSFNLNFTIG
jgi:hypothetical protein